MLAGINKWWVEFLYSQEMQQISLLHLWYTLKDWWSYRPRIIHCAFCKAPMWWNGKKEGAYCGQECAYMGPLLEESEELPF